MRQRGRRPHPSAHVARAPRHAEWAAERGARASENWVCGVMRTTDSRKAWVGRAAEVAMGRGGSPSRWGVAALGRTPVGARLAVSSLVFGRSSDAVCAVSVVGHRSVVERRSLLGAPPGEEISGRLPSPPRLGRGSSGYCARVLCPGHIQPRDSHDRSCGRAHQPGDRNRRELLSCSMPSRSTPTPRNHRLPDGPHHHLPDGPPGTSFDVAQEIFDRYLRARCSGDCGVPAGQFQTTLADVDQSESSPKCMRTLASMRGRLLRHPPRHPRKICPGTRSLCSSVGAVAQSGQDSTTFTPSRQIVVESEPRAWSTSEALE